METLHARLATVYASRRAIVGKLAFEILIIVIGVTAAFALEGLRKDREESAYQSRIITALIPTLNDAIRHGLAFEREVAVELATFDAAIARGEQPALPIFRESNSERPPIRIWDSVVATGAARALEPDLLFRLSTFYNRQESFGERYVRYATNAEQNVLTRGSDRSAFYDASGKLKPEFAAFVDRLRDLQSANRKLTEQATTLRAELERRKQ